MTPEQLDHFRLKLEKEQQELRASEDANPEATQAVTLDQASVGRLSRMDALQGQAMAMETQRRRQRRLTQIQQALGRMEHGDFGVCQQCEQDIALRRLDIDPATRHCITCASARETH